LTFMAVRARSGCRPFGFMDNLITAHIFCGMPADVNEHRRTSD
jgi:hypothetical protein